MIISKYHKSLTIIAIITIVAGLIGLTEWLTGWKVINEDFLSSATMKFNTSLCFVLTGISLLAYLNGKKNNPAFYFITCIVFLIAFISFIEDVFSFTSFIDEFFAKDNETRLISPGLPPGRMSTLTSLCFLSISLSNFFIGNKGKIVSYISQYLLHLVTLSGGIVFIRYIYKVPSFYSISGVSSMAVSTSSLFFLLSIGLSLLRPDKGVTALFTNNYLGGKIASRLFPIVIILTLLMGFVRLLIQKNNNVSIEFAIALNTLVFLLVSLLTIAITAHYINSVDKKRTIAENSLEEINKNLQKIVADKTEDLEKVTNRLSIATASSGIGIWDWDIKTDTITWDDNMCHLYGMNPSEFKGVRQLWIESIHPEDKNRVLLEVEEAFQGIKELDTEFRITWPDQSVHYLRAFSNVQRDENGAPIRMVGTNWDITVEKIQLERIRQSEEQYHKMIAGVQDYAIILLDKEGNIKTWNKGAEKIHGYREKDIVGKNFRLFYTVADIDKQLPERLLSTAIKEGKVFKEFLRVRKDGSLFWGSILIASLYDTEGNVTGFTKVTRDLTETKKAEEVIKNNEKKFQLMLSSLGDNAWEHDYITGKTEFSENIENLVGFKYAELLDNVRLWWDIVHPDDLHLLKKSDRKYREGVQNSHSIEYRIYHKSGAIKWVLDRGVVIEKNDEGKPIRVIGTHSDISERKFLQSINKEQEETIRLFVKHTPAAVAMFDTQMNYIVASDRWHSDYGLEGQTIIGKCHYDIFPEIRNMTEWMNIHQRCLKGVIEKKEEDPFPRKNGKVDWLQWEVRPWRKQDDSIGGIIMFTEVISSKVLAREHLKKLNEQLTTSNKELEQFAYVASHDLQEPLRMISSFLRLLEKKYGRSLDETGKQYINFAVDGADRMKLLIKNLLEFSRVSVSQKEISLIVIKELLEETSILYKEEIVRTGTRIEYGEMPEINGDKIQIGQVFQNLIGNAIKYGNPHNPKIEIGFEEKEEYWQFSILDNGIGINPKYFNKIFVIFQRLHTKNEYSGTGIGLSVCKKIIESHGGKIWVDSEEGKGSCFYFTIAKNLER